MELLSELQSRLDDVHNRTMDPTSIIKDDDEDLEALSPVRIYKFHVEEEDVKCEDEQLCEVIKRFAWLGEVQDANSTFFLFGPFLIFNINIHESFGQAFVHDTFSLDFCFLLRLKSC